MNEASEERTQRREGRLTVRHHFPPCQPDRMGREPQPPRHKNEAKRSDEGRQGEGTPACLSSKLISPAIGGTNQKISGWLAGRWRLQCGAAVDALLLCVIASRVLAKLQCRYISSGVPQGL